MPVRLSDFVAEAISDIAHGIHLAKANTYEIIAVTPGTLNGDRITEKSYIEFDIAVTATSEKTTKGSKSGKAGAGISVLGAKIGVDGTLASETGAKDLSGLTSRISFKVPVYFNAHFRGDSGAAQEAAFIKRKASSRDEE
jgi:hypothetical protein